MQTEFAKTSARKLATANTQVLYGRELFHTEGLIFYAKCSFNIKSKHLFEFLKQVT